MRGRVAALLSLTLLLLLAASAAGQGGSGGRGEARGAPPGLARAIAAQERHNPTLLAVEGVVGTGAGIDERGRVAVKVFVERAGLRGVPASLDGVPVDVEVTGKIFARAATTDRFRPAPAGVSVGHPLITAGTLGARVKNASGVYILSNNHVLAGGAIDDSELGAHVLQPGPYDGGADPDDWMATVADYVPLNVCFLFVTTCDNTMDAAIARVTNADDVVPQTFCGWTPSATTLTAVLGMTVKKCGRTTVETSGTIDAVNVTLEQVCYDPSCLIWARFTDQISMGPDAFSAGGDSGSLIVTNDGSANPVALLFAGGEGHTFAHPIASVLTALGVTIDGGSSPPPPPPPPPPGPTKAHVGDLDDVSTRAGKNWVARVVVTVHNDLDGIASSATVTGSWSNGLAGASSCTTNALGTCEVAKNAKARTASARFAVTNVAHATLGYDAAANHDVDGGTNGTAITVARP
jgi:hypothetical protein